MAKLDSKIPEGNISDKWTNHKFNMKLVNPCLLYTSDAADERSSVDLGGRRIIKKNTQHNNKSSRAITT